MLQLQKAVNHTEQKINRMEDGNLMVYSLKFYHQYLTICASFSSAQAIFVALKVSSCSTSRQFFVNKIQEAQKLSTVVTYYLINAAKRKFCVPEHLLCHWTDAICGARHLS